MVCGRLAEFVLAQLSGAHDNVVRPLSYSRPHQAGTAPPELIAGEPAALLDLKVEPIEEDDDG